MVSIKELHNIQDKANTMDDVEKKLSIILKDAAFMKMNYIRIYAASKDQADEIEKYLQKERYDYDRDLRKFDIYFLYYYEK